jgi:catechol 2,3-dioxygenase-like lactoylglutathione lyase family enzyme
MVVPKTKIHLRVFDTNRSAAFYEALLGAAPSVLSTNVAIFELESPPLFLTLEEHPNPTRVKPRPANGDRRPQGSQTSRLDARTRSRFALLVNEPRDMGAAAIALRRAGVQLRLEDQAIEAHDPDGNAWHVRFVPSTPDRSVVEA